MSRPLLSIVVPVHQGAAELPTVLGALAASDLARDRWELIVVDDASSDDSATIAAEWADQVVSLRGRARGPAYARNRGAEASVGEWLMFVDADVAVHTNTLTTVATIIEENPHIDAIIGAYDDAPRAPGFLSQYRNLLHRYTHLSDGGDAATFWAGCGAIRRTAFVAVDGFDHARYCRPQIEDIELGYRLRDRGSRIVLRPDVQGTHLKRWTLLDATRTDVWDRGVPWVRLLLERGELSSAGKLNLNPGERSKTAIVGMALALAAGAAVLQRPEPAVAAAACLFAVAASNVRQFLWLSRSRGLWFAAAAVPMNLWYYIVSGTCVVLGLGLHVLRVPERRRGSAIA